MEDSKELYFAAGCFWGAEKFFKLIDGVIFTEVGFANGNTPDPTYKEVYTDSTGYAETVHLRYDASRSGAAELARLFFRIIDPLSLNKQGEDEGTRYRTGIYYTDEEDLPALRTVFSEVRERLGREPVVELLPLRNFYRAEEMHQDYLDKNPGGYCHLSEEFFTLARKFRKL